MNLADRKAIIEAKSNYIAESLNDTTDGDFHTLTYSVNSKIMKYENGEWNEQTVTKEIKEVWKVYLEGTTDEYIEAWV